METIDKKIEDAESLVRDAVNCISTALIKDIQEIISIRGYKYIKDEDRIGDENKIKKGVFDGLLKVMGDSVKGESESYWSYDEQFSFVIRSKSSFESGSDVPVIKLRAFLDLAEIDFPKDKFTLLNPEAPLGTAEMPVEQGPDWKAVSKEISDILNCESIDSELNIPDFILANYLVDQLRVLKAVNRASELWHGPGICVKPHSGERNQDKHEPDCNECEALDMSEKLNER